MKLLSSYSRLPQSPPPPPRNSNFQREHFTSYKTSYYVLFE